MLGMKCRKKNITKFTTGQLKEEMERSTYLHGEDVQLPNGQRIHIYVDGIGAGRSSPLLYINDGRKDIFREETKEDKHRMNTVYVSVLCNGWPLILVESTKSIKAGESLWINYGPHYGALLDDQALVLDERSKTMRAVNGILRGIDLKERRPLEIFDDSDGVVSKDATTTIGKKCGQKRHLNALDAEMHSFVDMCSPPRRKKTCRRKSV